MGGREPSIRQEIKQQSLFHQIVCVHACMLSTQNPKQTYYVFTPCEFQVQKGSWGYLLERGVALGAEVVARLSRVPEGTRGSHHLEEEDEYGADHTSQIHLAGRVVLNVWRLMRAEVRTTLVPNQRFYKDFLIDIKKYR